MSTFSIYAKSISGQLNCKNVKCCTFSCIKPLHNKQFSNLDYMSFLSKDNRYKIRGSIASVHLLGCSDPVLEVTNTPVLYSKSLI